MCFYVGREVSSSRTRQIFCVGREISSNSQQVSLCGKEVLQQQSAGVPVHKGKSPASRCLYMGRKDSSQQQVSPCGKEVSSSSQQLSPCRKGSHQPAGVYIWGGKTAANNRCLCVGRKSAAAVSWCPCVEREVSSSSQEVSMSGKRSKQVAPIWVTTEHWVYLLQSLSPSRHLISIVCYQFVGSSIIVIIWSNLENGM
ncbi:hypothetical protein J6590_056571 [Homalodisca vitripennis]|nr:hypothetical protein J6590_056571 [Homalodisca vitripennis]